MRKASSEYKKNNRREVAAKHKKYKSTFQGLLSNAKSLAKRRGLCFDMESYEYEVLRNQDCLYCGGKLPKTGMALDRIDSNLGYTRENSVPCCTVCNKIKNEYSVDFLLQRLPKIIEALKRIKEISEEHQI